jgi:fluoride ion exporter CrcB/FEX
MLLFTKEVSYMFSIILGGLIGGALRGIMGIAKSLILKKEEQINYGWFFVSVAVAMAIGVFAASFMGGGFEIALLSGYAGSDLLESLVKLKFKEKFEKLVKI